MAQNLQPPRGMHDLAPEEHKVYIYVCNKVRTCVEKYSFSEISTPIIENAEIFVRAAGASSDVVSKEMYCAIPSNEIEGWNELEHSDSLNANDNGDNDVVDKAMSMFEAMANIRGGDIENLNYLEQDTERELYAHIDFDKLLVLRPESTASVARFICNAGLTQSLPQKLFVCGPMFRHERPQKGRLRQFHQLSVEHIGVAEPWADVEAILCAIDCLSELNISARLEINTLGDIETREKYRDVLINYFESHEHALSEYSALRFRDNPMRVLDSKNSQDIEICNSAPKIQDCLTDSARDFFEKVEKYLQLMKVEYFINQKLVRGLDYYNHTVFEFKVSELGAQSTIIGGGRYDGLVNNLMNNSKDKIKKNDQTISSIGWSIGIDRAMMLVKNSQEFINQNREVKFVFVPYSEEYLTDSLEICNILRSLNFKISIFMEGTLQKSISKAAKKGYSHALIFGETEKSEQYITIKDLKTGNQKHVPLSNISTIA
jgi:histidyl-tRNA synthetase